MDTNQGEGKPRRTEAGISKVTQLFAVLLGEFDIPAYEVRPGVIDTDMTAGVKEKYDKLIGEGLTVQRRWGYPDEVGKAVSALALGNFPYSTRQVIMIRWWTYFVAVLISIILFQLYIQLVPL